jgi:hypothetical protein
MLPATISPTRNAIVAVRQTVTTRKRRVICPIIAYFSTSSTTRAA